MKIDMRPRMIPKNTPAKNEANVKRDVDVAAVSNRGGKREGAGRPVTDNALTEMFTMRCTAEEKIELQRFAQRLRSRR